MADKRRVKPRREPIQARSKATVDALLKATAYILIRDGYVGLTTNRVAERAGVNIGSLYQFFPNKDALVVELERRHVEQTSRAMARAMARPCGSLRERLRTLVEAYVAAHAVDPALHRVLAEELPRISPRRRPKPSERCVGPEALAVFAPWAEQLPNLERSVWMIGTVCQAVVQHAAAERRAELQSGVVVEELVALLGGYLAA
jgi:AcrR family transcriptional regulator